MLNSGYKIGSLLNLLLVFQFALSFLGVDTHNVLVGKFNNVGDRLKSLTYAFL